MSKYIGIVGAGVMGKGIAQRLVQYGHKILLLDLNENILADAAKSIKRNLKINNMAGKKHNIDEIMQSIILSVDYEDFAEVDYVIENVTERFEVKREVYKSLEKVCKESCLYMVDTSCIPITAIAALTQREDKVIGVHFMNPVPLISFSEVIRGEYTSDETVKDIEAFLQTVGISIEVIKDSPGFVSNRLSHLLMNEAAFLVYENVASPQQIDVICQNCFGHKMGPLATADLIGIDTVLDSLKVLYDQYEDPKFRACPLLKKMVCANKLGVKTGEGFHQYV
ncbi:MAG: 3-hydroxyacyl-CoA dehydrogenase family protein [Clostridiales bacterium]|jgi:3-hydroxybutyryl-CoA dehydrogenase|nr:3-hydroxyacyl-CoA dehydrogenase family protein [Clostridiales bacterium]